MLFREGSVADKTMRKVGSKLRQEAVDFAKQKAEEFATDLARKGVKRIFSQMSKSMAK